MSEAIAFVAGLIVGAWAWNRIVVTVLSEQGLPQPKPQPVHVTCAICRSDADVVGWDTDRTWLCPSCLDQGGRMRGMI